VASVISTPRPDGPAFDPREYRSALGSFATGVTVTTMVDGSGRRYGVTANPMALSRHFAKSGADKFAALQRWAASAATMR